MCVGSGFLSLEDARCFGQARALNIFQPRAKKYFAPRQLKVKVLLSTRREGETSTEKCVKEKKKKKGQEKKKNKQEE